MDVSDVEFTRIMNFLLDKPEHQEMPNQQLNPQANLLQTPSAAVMENQSMSRCEMSFLGQISPNNSQTVCKTQGNNVTECLNGVEHSQNDVINSLLMGLCEPGHLNNTSCTVFQTSSEGRAPHTPDAGHLNNTSCAVSQTSSEGRAPHSPRAGHLNNTSCVVSQTSSEGRAPHSPRAGHLNNTSYVVSQTSSEGRAPHSPRAVVSRRRRRLPNHSRNATRCNKQTYPTPETGAANEVQHDETLKVKRNRGPKPKIMYNGNGPMQLWQFVLSLLVSSPSERVVEWTRERKYEFRILEPDKLAKLWGALKKKPAMTFKKLTRGLRYYYGKSMLEKVRGKQFTYEFVMDITTILGYDPVGENAEGQGSSGNTVSPLSAVLPSDELHVPDVAQQGKGHRGNGEGLSSKLEGSSGIKLFDFSVLVESNETSSFYEAL